MRKFFARFLPLLLLLTPAAAWASTPVIMSVSYVCTDSPIHIGSSITFTVAVGNATSSAMTLSVSGTAAASYLLLTSSELASSSVGVGAQVIVTDGKRTWQTIKNADGSCTINDGYRQVGPVLADYTTLGTATFRAYLGTIAKAASAADQVWLMIGNSSIPDLRSFDCDGATGAWTKQYTLPNLGVVMSDVALRPQAYLGGGYASLPEALPDNWVISGEIDALLPQVTNLAISGVRDSLEYSGMLYIAKSSMDSGAAAAWNSDNMVAKLAADTNKANCSLNVSVDLSGAGLTNYQQSAPVLVEDQVAPYSRTMWWSGRGGVDGVDAYAPDGKYVVSVGVTDRNGVQGVTVTAVVYVTSLVLEVKDLNVNPKTVDVASSDPVVTNISYNVYLRNDNGTSILPALVNLGWDFGPPNYVNNEEEYESKVFGIMDIDVLDSSNTVMSALSQTLSNRDTGMNVDSDADFIFMNMYDMPRHWYDGSNAAMNDKDKGFLIPNCFWTSYGQIVTGTATVGSSCNVGDGNKGNDWDTAFSPSCQFQVTQGTVYAPIVMKASWSRTWQSSSKVLGTYYIRARSTLTGMISTTIGERPTALNTVGCGAAPEYVGYSTHFYPSSRPDEGWESDYRGRRLYNQTIASEAVRIVKSSVAASDTTPPVLKYAVPSAGSTVAPDVYGPTMPLKIYLTDASPIDTSLSKVSLQRTLGGSTVVVPGNSTTNAGSLDAEGNNTATIYFTPVKSLTSGGTYTMTVTAADQKGNSAQYTVTFTIVDQGTPSVFQVQVINNSGQAFTAYPTTLTTPLDSVLKLSMVLTMDTASTANVIDGNSASLTLVRTDVTPNVKVPLGVAVKVFNSAKTTLTYTVPLETLFTSSGTFQIQITAAGLNGETNATYASTDLPTPTFSVMQSNNYVYVTLNGNVVMTMIRPVTITSDTATLDASIIRAESYNLAALTAPTNYAYLTGSAAVHFYANNGDPSRNLNFQFQPVSPTSIKLYFSPASLPTGVSATGLTVWGYDLDNAKWNMYGSSIWSMDIDQGSLMYQVPEGTPLTNEVYAIMYSSITNVTGGTPTATPTPVAFKSTRSFNPGHASSLHRKARIFYADKQPSDVEAKVFAMNGALVRTLNAGKGIDLAVSQADITYGKQQWYFEWDGANDSGTVVKNGVYLVVTRVKYPDGSSNTVKNTLALIK